MGRHNPWLKRIESLDPAVDYAEIYRLHYMYEYPWDTVQSLSFALFRTFAIPSIGKLLYDTGEFTERTQKRYDDTNLIIDTVVEAGFGAGHGREAIRRMNGMHGSYQISNEDFIYVLATFVVCPFHWLAKYGWRAPTRNEIDGATNFYREMGRLMGLKNIPETYEDFDQLLADYERDNFAFDDKSRAVSDSTLDLLGTIAPFSYLPSRIVRRFALALMDEPLLDAFHYPHPSGVERTLAEAGLKLRAAIVARLPKRMRAYHARRNPAIRSYPCGYRVAELGTFPRGCPVAHHASNDGSGAAEAAHKTSEMTETADLAATFGGSR
ncbi:oxygenase MpaB family protein [Gordonia sputi]